MWWGGQKAGNLCFRWSLGKVQCWGVVMATTGGREIPLTQSFRLWFKFLWGLTHSSFFHRAQLQRLSKAYLRENLVAKCGYLQSPFVSRVCFSVFVDRMPASIPHVSWSHVWCLVISQSFRRSLEDPDTAHENDHEPKLTTAGTAGLTWAGAAAR